MMKRNLVLFATVVMNVCMAMAQGFSEADAAQMRGMDFEWEAETVKAAPAAKTSARATRTVSMSQLSAASARRQQTTTTRTRAAQTQQNAQQNLTPMQQQLQETAAATQQQEVICGTVEHVYNMGFGNARIRVRKAGMFGGIFHYSVIGYNDPIIPFEKGDYVCFIVTYNGAYEYPMVNFNEVINTTGMTRYMLWYSEHYYGGNTMMMYSANPKMTKWNKVINGVVTGAYAAASVASVISLIKSIF